MISACFLPICPVAPISARILAQRPQFGGAKSLSRPQAPLRYIELRAKSENMNP